MQKELTGCWKDQKEDFLLLLENYHHSFPLNISRKSSFPQAPHHSTLHLKSLWLKAQKSIRMYRLHWFSWLNCWAQVVIMYSAFLRYVYACPHFQMRKHGIQGSGEWTEHGEGFKPFHPNLGWIQVALRIESFKNCSYSTGHISCYPKKIFFCSTKCRIILLTSFGTIHMAQVSFNGPIFSQSIFHCC